MLEPQTNYFIGRLETPVINDISRVGLMMTDVARLKYPGATVTGLDWKLNFLDNRLFSTGQVIHSSTNGTSGNAFRFNAGYTDPVWWSVRFWYGYYDDTFDVNDLGFLRRNNINWAGGRIELRKQEPWGKFLNNDFSPNLSSSGAFSFNDHEISSSSNQSAAEPPTNAITNFVF